MQRTVFLRLATVRTTIDELAQLDAAAPNLEATRAACRVLRTEMDAIERELLDLEAAEDDAEAERQYDRRLEEGGY